MNDNDPVAPEVFQKKRPSCPSARCIGYGGTQYLGTMYHAYRCGECYGVYSKSKLKANTETANPQLPRLELDIA